MVVQGNHIGIRLLSSEGGGILGFDRDKVLSEELNWFVDKVIKEEVAIGRVLLNGADYKINGRAMTGPCQEGIVLVFAQWGEELGKKAV